MSQIIVSPREQRQFSKELAEALMTLRAKQMSFQAATSDIRSTWNDERFSEFMRKWQLLEQQLSTVYRIGETYCEYLDRKSQAGERYLSGR